MAGQITHFEEPETLEQGQKYYLRNKVKNMGTELATFRQRYFLRWEDRELISTTMDLLPGEEGSFILIGELMPSQDAVFDVYLERGPLWIQDDYHLTTIKLGYGEPHVTIESTDFPEFQYPGSPVEVTATIRNTGSTSAYTAMRVLRHWEDKETTTKWVILDPGQEGYGKVTFFMPDQDATLTISFLRLHDSEWIIDDSTEITVKLKEIPPPPPPPPPPPIMLILLAGISVVTVTAGVMLFRRPPKKL